MVNLKELFERYKDVGLGYISFGGKSYYEIDSDIPLSLNSFGGKDGFVLNDEGQVELYDLTDKVLIKRHYYSDENWDNEVDYETKKYWDETEANKLWGKTLDNYYPHPWYADKKIIAFEIINNLPFNRKGVTVAVNRDKEASWIELETFLSSYHLNTVDCLLTPEFFKPIYEK